MTDIWEKLKESVEFYNAEGFIPRRDIRNTISALIEEGDKLSDKLEAVISKVKEWDLIHMRGRQSADSIVHDLEGLLKLPQEGDEE